MLESTLILRQQPPYRVVAARVALVTLLLLISCRLHAQQDNTLFFMHSLPQSNMVNPAVQIECKTFVGIPLLSSIHFNANSTGFSYNSFSPGATSVDLNRLTSGLFWWDYVTAEFHYNWIALGYRPNERDYYNFSVTEKVDMKLFFPKKLVMLARDGNTPYVGDEFTVRNPGINAFYYREFSFGYSRKMDSRLTLGAHAKVLFGMAGVFTRRRPIHLNVDGNTYNLNADWNLRADAAGPMTVGYDANGYVNSIGVGAISPVAFLLNFRNVGLASDLGFIYHADVLTWSGSVLDLGLIYWTAQTHRFRQDGSFVFSGATPANGTDPNAYIAMMRDSLNNQLRVKEAKGGFVSFLNPRAYVGATYPLSDHLNAGALLRTELYPGRPIMGTTLSLNAFGWKGFSGSVSYSAMNGSLRNIGLGFGVGSETFKIHLISDNVLAFFFPSSARNANIRFGMHLMLGCHEKKRSPSKSSYNGCGCFWQWDEGQKRRAAGVK